MSTRAFQRIAWLTLSLAVVGAWEISRFVVPFLTALDDDLRALLAVLGYALSLLVAVCVWAVLLLPLRSISDLPSLREDFEELQQEGFAETLHRERQALEDRSTSHDSAKRAAYHRSMTLAGGGLTALGAVLTGALLLDGTLMALPLAMAVVGLPMTVAHGVGYLRWSQR